MKAVQPRPFEAYGQNQGLVLYRTTLVGRKSGRLQVTDLHDYALVFVDGRSSARSTGGWARARSTSRARRARRRCSTSWSRGWGTSTSGQT